MATNISSVTARDKLKPQREPYWHRVLKGCYLGYRKMTTDRPGIWWARCRDAEANKQHAQSLGTLEELPPSQRFDKAMELAREWFTHIGMGGTPTLRTVQEACETYLAHVRRTKGVDPAKDLEGRYKRWVYSAAIAKIELTKLRPEQVEKWRDTLATSAPAADGTTKARALDSINRDMTALRAALNHSKERRAVTTDFAWSGPLKPIKNAGKPRELYLDKSQRRAFIENAAPDLQIFLRGLAALPLRPGALADLTAGAFEKRLGVLSIGKDKNGKARKIELPDEVKPFFAEQARGKLPAAPLLARADGQAWNKDAWKKPIKEAVKAASLPAAATAYTVRHSVITDMVHGGSDLLTVAQLSGTSVAMIEKTYGHLRNEVAKAALSKLGL